MNVPGYVPGLQRRDMTVTSQRLDRGCRPVPVSLARIVRRELEASGFQRSRLAGFPACAYLVRTSHVPEGVPG